MNPITIPHADLIREVLDNDAEIEWVDHSPWGARKGVDAISVLIHQPHTKFRIKPANRIIWYNVYPTQVGVAYASRERADFNAYLARTGVLRIELSGDSKTHISTTMEPV